MELICFAGSQFSSLTTLSLVSLILLKLGYVAWPIFSCIIVSFDGKCCWPILVERFSMDFMEDPKGKA